MSPPPTSTHSTTMRSYTLTTLTVLVIGVLAATLVNTLSLDAVPLVPNRGPRRLTNEERHEYRAQAQAKPKDDDNNNNDYSNGRPPPVIINTQPTQNLSIGIGQATNVDDQALLNAHNKKRATVGAGKLTWDNTIAQYSIQYGQQCVFQHSSNGGYAENLAGAWGFNTTTTMSLFDYLWSEGKACNYRPSGCSYEQAGHYLNIIAPETTRLGCAVVRCGSSLLSGLSDGEDDGGDVVKREIDDGGAPIDGTPGTPGTPGQPGNPGTGGGTGGGQQDDEADTKFLICDYGR